MNIFYGGAAVCDASNFPPIGEPTLLCFNHMNGLTDPMMLMTVCPRMVRFIAMDSLWKMPIIGWLVRSAAAVPVKRPKDHGGGLDHGQTQEAVLEAWDNGHIIGVSPEGASTVSTMQSKPFKKGFQHWLVDAVLRHWEDEDFKITVLTCGMVYLHPWSWRSEVMVRFGTPFVFDRTSMQKHGATDLTRNLDPSDEHRHAVSRSAVNDLCQHLEQAIGELAINVSPPLSPDPAEEKEGDWAALRSGIVAARILYPEVAEELSLRKWIELVKHLANELQKAEHNVLDDSVQDYYHDLTKHGLRDLQVHEVIEDDRPGPCFLFCHMLLRLQQSFLLLACAIPGVVCWMPLWLFVSLFECVLVRKGRVVKDGQVKRRGYNFDLLASVKLLPGFLYLSAVCATAGILTLLWLPSLIGHAGWIGWSVGLAAGLLVAGCIVPGMLLLSMRLCECGIRAALTAWEVLCLLCIKDEDLQSLTAARSQLHELLAPLLTDKEQALLRSESPLDRAPRRGIWKRLKADWHECFLAEDLTWHGLVSDRRHRRGVDDMLMPLIQHSS